MSHPTTWKPPTLFPNEWMRQATLVIGCLYLVWSIGSFDVNWDRIAQGIPRAGNMIARMFPPDFGRWELLVKGVVESLEMAFTASFVGMILAIPLGLCGASNLAPRPVYLAARSIIVLTRTFHEVIIAIFFVKIFGFGPLAGVLTLIVASVSFISKMIAEDIENMNPGQVEAIRANGADFPKLLIYAIVPQILPAFAGITVFRWDINIRESTVVGLVGAGGIGLELNAQIMELGWASVAVILISILSTVLVSEWVSAKVRHAII